MDMAPVIRTRLPAPGLVRAAERMPMLLLSLLVVVPWMAVIALAAGATLGLKLLAAAPQALVRSLLAQPRLLADKATGQLIRFAIAGLGVTALSALVYLVAAMACGLDPLVANTISHLVGVGAGFAAHSRWSFRAERSGGSSAVLRFVVASAAAFALNSAWVWLATGLLGLPAWTPIPAMLVATPLASFALNRYWVFAAARP